MFLRHGIHQNNIVVTHKQATQIKHTIRSKHPLAVTPLRQVMSKSIQRAIREQIGTDTQLSPKSPLDLRSSPVIRRSSANKENTKQTPVQTSDHVTETNVQHKRLSSASMTSVSILETVYEQVNADVVHNKSQTSAKQTSLKERAIDCEEISVQKQQIDVTIETPAIVKKFSEEKNNNNDFSKEVWYTPAESLIAPIIESQEVKQIFS